MLLTADGAASEEAHHLSCTDRHVWQAIAAANRCSCRYSKPVAVLVCADLKPKISLQQGQPRPQR